MNFKKIGPCHGGMHDKCYAPYTLCSYPAQHPWACRRCGVQGVDVGQAFDQGEYERLLEKATKQ